MRDSLYGHLIPNFSDIFPTLPNRNIKNEYHPLTRFEVGCDYGPKFLLSCCIPDAQFDLFIVQFDHLVPEVYGGDCSFCYHLVMDVSPEDGSLADLAVSNKDYLVLGTVKYCLYSCHIIKITEEMTQYSVFAMLLRITIKIGVGNPINKLVMQIIYLPKREISSMMSCMTYYSFTFSKEVYLQECLFSFQTTMFHNKRFNSLTELLLLLNFTIFIMQEHQKLLKKTNKSAVEQRTLDLRQKQNQLQALLRIDLITIPEKMARNKRIQSNISRETTSRKSHKSLAINLQKYAKPPKDKPKKQNLPPKVQTAKVRKPDTEKTSEKQTIEQKKQRTNSIKAPTQYAKQPIQHEFVEKKTKVGQKIKTNAMKEFILQTLMKGKAEGTCLVIHKGTAHCSYSPIAKNKSETSKHQKEQYPLILVQNHKDAIERRNKPNQSTFGQRPTKVNKSSSTKSTAVNLPSINKKLVKMAKQLQKKQNKKLQANESMIEVIEQKIEACEEQKENQIEQIHQQILVSNNESIIKGNVKIE